MKTIFLLLSIGFISSQGFAGSSKGDAKSGDKNGGVLKTVLETAKNLNPNYKAKTQWLSRLNESNWRERLGAVKDWKTVFQYAPEEIFSQLELRLSDKSQKVREAVVTAFEEMALEPDYSKFKKEIIKALAERRPNDTENLFLRKMKAATEIFKHTSLYTVLKDKLEEVTIINRSKIYHALEEPDESVDQVFSALYKMAETGLSAKQNLPLRLAAIQCLDILWNRLKRVRGYRGLFATSKAADQVFDYNLRGAQIALAGLADRNPEMHSDTKDLLSRSLQELSYFDDKSKDHISQIILEIAKRGFSHPDYKMRIETIDWLLEIAELYPSLNSEIASILKARQVKENSHHMKVALKKAIRQLSASENTVACRESLSG